MNASASFQSAPARFNGRVVFRRSTNGPVWAKRLPRAGQRPSPSALFYPVASRALAVRLALAATWAGLSAEVKPAEECALAGFFAATGALWVAKVRLPVGVSSASARVAVRNVWVANARELAAQ
jgi:hypothetical protein